MSASCTLINKRRSAEDKKIETPRKGLKYAAMATGRVLNGLTANPSVGKITGVAWNSTVSAVNMPPIETNRISGFFNRNLPNHT